MIRISWFRRKQNSFLGLIYAVILGTVTFVNATSWSTSADIASSSFEAPMVSWIRMYGSVFYRGGKMDVEH